MNVLLRMLLVIVLFAVVGISAQAADDLITQQITIKLDEAGTLSSKIGSKKQTKITNLKLVGEIESDDFLFLKKMTNLAILDLSETKVVDYLDLVGCSSLTSLTLPPDITSIGVSAFFGCRSLTSLVIPSGVTYKGLWSQKHDGAVLSDSNNLNITLQPIGIGTLFN